MHLLDTAVVWVLRRPSATSADDPLFEWAGSLLPSTAFLSVVTLMDLEGGAARMERKDRAAAVAIRNWTDSRLRTAFEGRILPIDDAVVRRWSRLGYSDLRDGLLAATALEHGLIIATNQPASFRSGKVKTFNPWTYSPDAELDWRKASHSAPLWLKGLFVRG